MSEKHFKCRPAAATRLLTRGLQTKEMSRCRVKERTEWTRHCLLSRMVNWRFFFAQGRSLHQRAAHRDPKRGPLPSAPPVQEQALHPHSGEAQMGQVQADLQVFTLLQTLAWAGNCKRRLFQTICNLTVVKLHLHLKHTGQNEALRPRVQILPASS